MTIENCPYKKDVECYTLCSACGDFKQCNGTECTHQMRRRNKTSMRTPCCDWVCVLVQHKERSSYETDRFNI